MRIRSTLASLLAASALLGPGLAHADEGDAVPRWEWPRFQWWEYVGTAALGATALTVRFAIDLDEDPTWDADGILGDDWVLDHLRAEDPDAYDAWTLAGDIPYYGSLIWPVLDPLAVGAVDGGWDVASQMFLINVEAYAFFAAVLWTTQHFVRRERPNVDLCDDPQEAQRFDVSCAGPNRIRSFIGGHTGVVTMNAALTCLHHGEMDLYGDAGDALACGAWIVGAGVTFVSRTVNATHYLSDNVLGVGLGLISGGLLPWALHYAHDLVDVVDLDPLGDGDGPRIVGASVTPDFAGGGLEIEVKGTL